MEAMSTKNTGGSAFPTQESEPLNNGERAQYAEPGMTLRDYFAAKAIHGILTREVPYDFWHRIKRFLGFDYDVVDINAEGFAMEAYDFADAMLKAREQ